MKILFNNGSRLEGQIGSLYLPV